MVERFLARSQWQRRIVIRGEWYTDNMPGVIQLATMTILLRIILR